APTLARAPAALTMVMRHGTGAGLPAPCSCTVISTVASASTRFSGRSCSVIAPTRMSSATLPILFDNEGVLTREQPARGNRQPDDHVVFVADEAAQLLAIKQHLPRLPHVLLAQP